MAIVRCHLSELYGTCVLVAIAVQLYRPTSELSRVSVKEGHIAHFAVKIQISQDI